MTGVIVVADSITAGAGQLDAAKDEPEAEIKPAIDTRNPAETVDATLREEDSNAVIISSVMNNEKKEKRGAT